MSNPSSKQTTNNAAAASTGLTKPLPTSASTKPTSPYAVSDIPAFRGSPGINYAQAASKSKPSPPSVNGKDVAVSGTFGQSAPAVSAALQASSLAASASTSPHVTASVSPAPSASYPSGSADGHTNQSTKVNAVDAPSSRLSAMSGVADSISFGNINDRHATLSSSPAAPPPASNGNPKTFGTVPAGSKAPLNLHSFFTGGASAPTSTPSPSGSNVQSSERRGPAVYDPQGHAVNASARSPQSTAALSQQHYQGHASQLSSSSASFAPRQQAPPFVPAQTSQQVPHMAQTSSYSSPTPQFAHAPSASAYASQLPYGSKSPAMQPASIGSYSPGPHGNQQSQAQIPRSGSFTGSALPSVRPQGPNAGRASFAGATSPRMQSSTLPQQGMMFGHQPNWNQQPYGQQQYAYYGMQFPAQNAYALSPQPSTNSSSLAPSGSTTPSAGVRTPATSASVTPGLGGTPNHSASHSIASTSQFSSFSSPQSQAATLPQHPSFHGSSSTNASTPLRSLAHAPEFKPTLPNADAPSWSPSPRKSAAIKIRNPKEVQAEREAAAAAEAARAGGAPLVSDASGLQAAKAVSPSTKASNEASDQTLLTSKQPQAGTMELEHTDRMNLTKADGERVEIRDDSDASKPKAREVDTKGQVASPPLSDESVKPRAEDDSLANRKIIGPEEDQEFAEAPERSKKQAHELEGRKSTTTASEATTTPASEHAMARDVKSAQDVGESLAEARSTAPASPVDPPAASAPSSKVIDDSTNSTNDLPKAGPSSASLSAARKIDDLESITYPEKIKSPRAELNLNAEPGKYRYDREFLMQFMNVCIEKPDQLPNLEAIGMVDSGGEAGPSRGNFGAGNRRTSMGPPATANRGAGAGGFGSRSTSVGGVGAAFGSMGSFGQAPLGTSEARFAQASLRASSGAFGGGRAGGAMSRTPSQSGLPGFVPAAVAQAGRNRSDRGKPRDRDGNRGHGGGGGGGGKHTAGDGFENATLAPRSETGWVPTVIGGAPTLDANSPELVQRKVKALLNKLTLERFESISNQILEWADKSVTETDGRILRQVIALIFEKATDEANWSEMYARLCRKLMEKVSSNIRDESVKSGDGSFVTGGALFRKYLLNRCQEDYESGWKLKETAAAAAADKAADDNAKKDMNDQAEKEAKEKGDTAPTKEAELLSDEYYAAQKAKRRGLGLVRFIGELYRLQMLTERIMHECIKKLLANTENPDEEDVESLCRLLTTVGKYLDNPKAKQHMDIYFQRMHLIANSPKVPSRMRFMILDVADLRSNGWQPRHDSAGPKLISEIHSDAQKAAEEASRRVASSGGKGLPRLNDQLSRPNSRRGQGRDDGWSAPVPQRPAKAGDLSAFGKTRGDSAAPITFGPTGAFAAKAKAKEAARPVTPNNPFAILSGGPDPTADASASQRPKLNLAPRTKPLDGDQRPEGAPTQESSDVDAPVPQHAGHAADGVEEHEEEEEEEEEDDDDGAIDANAVSMSRTEAERKAGNSVKEFFSVKSISEGALSVEALPSEYRGILVAALAEAAFERKPDDINLCRQLFAELSKEIVQHQAMLNALKPLIVNKLIDFSFDIPKVFEHAAALLVGAQIGLDEVEAMLPDMSSEEDDDPEQVEKGRQKLLEAFTKVSSASQ